MSVDGNREHGRSSLTEEERRERTVRERRGKEDFRAEEDETEVIERCAPGEKKARTEGQRRASERQVEEKKREGERGQGRARRALLKREIERGT